MTRKFDVVFDSGNRNDGEVVLVVYENNKIVATHTGDEAIDLFEDLTGEVSYE